MGGNHRILPLLLLASLVCQTAAAGEVSHAGVRRSGGVYYLDLDASIDADLETVYRIVTDYDGLHRLSRMLLGSALLDAPDGERRRLDLLARSCILVFCFRVRAVNDLVETGHTVHATIIPALSDFKSGTTSWSFQRLDDDRCRLRVSGELVPDFWIPPVIGPFVIKRKMIREAGRIISRIEEQGGNV